MRNKTKQKETQIVEVVGSPAANLEDILKINKVDEENWEVDKYTIKQNSKGFSYDIYLRKKDFPVDEIEAIKRELVALNRVSTKIEYKRREDGTLLEFAPFDLHFSKLAWARESGEDYDMNEAAIALNKAIDYTLGMASKFNVGRIVFPFGQDFFHIDNEGGTTTSGTPQDVDSRFKKVIKEGRKLVVSTIEKLKRVAPVDVIVVPGNHGRMAEFQLGDLLEVKYENDKNVNINNEPTDRKYYSFGNSFILYTHGDQERLDSLPLIMATSMPKEWAASKFRFIKCGHIHQERMKEFCGVKVEVLSSLAATDAWHSRKGYINNVRGVISSVYDRNMGMISKIYFNL